MNIKTKKAGFQKSIYMCTYPLQQHKHNQKNLYTNFIVLHVYIPSTTTRTKLENIIPRFPVLKEIIHCTLSKQSAC